MPLIVKPAKAPPRPLSFIVFQDLLVPILSQQHICCHHVALPNKPFPSTRRRIKLRLGFAALPRLQWLDLLLELDPRHDLEAWETRSRALEHRGFLSEAGVGGSGAGWRRLGWRWVATGCFFSSTLTDYCL